MIRVYNICHSQLSEQDLHCHSNLIRVYTISQQSEQGQGPLSFLGIVWSWSTLFDILRSLIRVYTVCHSQQSDQCLHLWKFSAVWSLSTLSAILSSLIRVHTISHSQQSDQGLHCLPFSVFWSGYTLFAIHSSLNTDYTVCHSQQSNQGLRYLPFWVWSGSIPFAILSILIKVCTVILSSLINVKVHWHSQEKFNQGLQCLPHYFHSQQPDQGLHYLLFSAVWAGSTLYAILSILISLHYLHF